MPDYQLSITAEKALIEIIADSEERFGAHQADAYYAGLISTFELLAQFPGIGVASYEVKQGWHRYRFQSHYVFYSDQQSHVFIEAIVHTKRDVRPDLFDT